MRPHIVIAAVILMLTQSAFAVRISDITRMGGQRSNVLTGMGLVVGLKGTGDGGKYLPAMRPLANMIKIYTGAGDLDLSNANNVAIVNVIATLPDNGVRSGDQLDVAVMSTGAATSLRGGVLYVASMMGPDGKPYRRMGTDGREFPPIAYALANGPVELPDPTCPTSGIVKGGAVMEVDLPAKFIDEAGRFTLILDIPLGTWQNASVMAKEINESDDSGDVIATATDPRTVVVQIPASERSRPDNFISQVLNLRALIMNRNTPHAEIPAPKFQSPVLAKVPTTQALANAASLGMTPTTISLWWVGGCVLLSTVIRSRQSKKNSNVVAN